MATKSIYIIRATRGRNKYVQPLSTPEKVVLGRRETAMIYEERKDVLKAVSTFGKDDYYDEVSYPRVLVEGRGAYRVTAGKYRPIATWIIKGNDGKVYYLESTSSVLNKYPMAKDNTVQMEFIADLISEEGFFRVISKPRSIETTNEQ